MLNYVAIDFETANSYRGSPCAVGLVRVRNGVPVAERRWLMRPPEEVDHFDSFNIWIHGITEDMVASEPRWKHFLPFIVDFIGDDVVVAHNAGFDIGVIRYACAVDNMNGRRCGSSARWFSHAGRCHFLPTGCRLSLTRWAVPPTTTMTLWRTLVPWWILFVGSHAGMLSTTCTRWPIRWAYASGG
jgi:Exonuclease